MVWPGPASLLGVCGELVRDVAAGPSGGVDSALLEGVADCSDVAGWCECWCVGDEFGCCALEVDGPGCSCWLVFSLARVCLCARW